MSSARSNLRNPTAIGQTLNAVGGPLFVAACHEYTDIGVGKVALTVSGNLSCRLVLHVVCCSWDQNKGKAEEVSRMITLGMFRF